MTYRFNVPQPKYVPRYPRMKALIPLTIAEAENVRPCEEIQPLWEGAIKSEVEEPTGRFNWMRFLMALVP